MGKQRGRSGSWWGQAGFSLAEILMATAISSVVLLALYLLYDINQVTFLKGEQQADLQQNARIAMDRIVRELRLAGFYPEDPPVIPPVCPTAIQSATATSVRFIADVTSDGATERIEYTLPACVPNCSVDPPKLRREQWSPPAGPTCTGWSIAGGAKAFAERVSALTFTYYDAGNNCLGGAPTAPTGDCPTPPSAAVPGGSLGNIRRISVTITTQDAQTGSKAQPFTLRAEVRPRNLGL